MFFLKFFYFLKGYVIIKVYGASVERFITFCVKRNIKLLETDRGTDYLACVVSNADFLLIRGFSRRLGIRVRILEKHGAYLYLRRLKRHMGFLVGLIIFPLVVFIMSQFVWSVEINGVSKVKQREISEALCDMGISEGVRTASLPNASDVKFSLIDRVDGISWAWMYICGTKVMVEAREGIPIPKVPDEDEPCDVVSQVSGIVRDIVVLRGDALVKCGDAVLADDILIAGTHTGKFGGISTTHASGRVSIETSHTASGVYPVFRSLEKKLSGSCTKYYLKLFGANIPLSFKKVPYTSYTQKNEFWEATLGEGFYLGFGVGRDTYVETVEYSEDIPYDTAVEIAKAELEEAISAELLPGAVLTDTRLTSYPTDEGVYVSLTMNFIENAGIEKILN